MAPNKKKHKDPVVHREEFTEDKNFVQTATRKLLFYAEMIPKWKITLIDCYEEFANNWDEESNTIIGHNNTGYEVYNYDDQLALLVPNNDYENVLPQYCHSVVIFWWQGVYQILVLDNTEMYEQFNKEAIKLL